MAFQNISEKMPPPNGKKSQGILSEHNNFKCWEIRCRELALTHHTIYDFVVFTRIAINNTLTAGIEHSLKQLESICWFIVGLPQIDERVTSSFFLVPLNST